MIFVYAQPTSFFFPLLVFFSVFEEKDFSDVSFFIIDKEAPQTILLKRTTV